MKEFISSVSRAVYTLDKSIRNAAWSFYWDINNYALFAFPEWRQEEISLQNIKKFNYEILSEILMVGFDPGTSLIPEFKNFSRMNYMQTP